MARLLLWMETFLSGALPFTLLLVFGAYLSVKTGFFQLRLFPAAMRYAFGGIGQKGKGGELTPFRSACTALSATVGTGNIAGVASAVSLGGAGAVFWMWVSAFAGMCVKAAEIALGLKFREKTGGGFTGGPMYVICNGLGEKKRFAAIAFSFAGLFAAVCGGAVTQTNAAATALQKGTYGGVILGIGFAVFCLFVLLGKGEKIGALNEILVPVMALLYMILAGTVIFLERSKLPWAFSCIIKGAFCPAAVTGGAIGSVITAVTVGASRGVFSNEAGLGTSGMAHAASTLADAKRQPLYGIFEVFTDTMLICTLTALTILCGGVKIEYGKTATGELVREAFSTAFGKSTGILLAGMICLFSVTSVIGWGFYGKLCFRFLAGERASECFTAVYPLFCIVGAIFPADAAWRLAAISTGFMLSINVIAMIGLAEVAVKEIRKIKGGKRVETYKNRTVTGAVGER